MLDAVPQRQLGKTLGVLSTLSTLVGVVAPVYGTQTLKFLQAQTGPAQPAFEGGSGGAGGGYNKGHDGSGAVGMAMRWGWARWSGGCFASRGALMAAHYLGLAAMALLVLPLGPRLGGAAASGHKSNPDPNPNPSPSPDCSDQSVRLALSPPNSGSNPNPKAYPHTPTDLREGGRSNKKTI